MIRTIGRIILAVVAAFLLISGIPALLNAWQAIQGITLESIWQDSELLAKFTTLLSAAWGCLLGLVAALAALFGRAGLWLTIFALIQIGIVIWNFYSMKQAGTLGDWKNILMTLVGFASPIGYFIGSIMIRFRSK